MTLHIYPELEQGSQPWLDARCGLLTASQIGKLITPKTIKLASNDTARDLTMQIVAERITGRTEFVYVNADMERGNLDEPICRDAYSEQFAPVEQVGFLTNEIGGYTVGFSPDGLVLSDGLIEIKSRKAKKQITTFLEGSVPLENMAQIQCGLLISGRKWCDYLSWSGGLPMYRHRVLPDIRWFDTITQAVMRFEEDAAQIVEHFENSTFGLPATKYIDHYLEMEIK